MFFKSCGFPGFVFFLFAWLAGSFTLSAQRVCSNWGLPEPACTDSPLPVCSSKFVRYRIKSYQDCCGARTLLSTENAISGYFPANPDSSENVCGSGCVPNEIAGGTCGTAEHQTSWFVFDIMPQADASGTVLQNIDTRAGAPAGTLRFKIIPCDIPPSNTACGETINALACNCSNVSIAHTLGDNGNRQEENISLYGKTDIDWALFKITRFGPDKAAACQAIKISGIIDSGSVKVSCNFSGKYGPSGLFEPGTSASETASGSRHNAPIKVNIGDRFILAADNYSFNITGYKIDFSGLGWRAFAQGPFSADDSTANVSPARPRIYADRPLTDLCYGDTVTLTASASPAYLWSNGAATQSIRVSRPGVYAVQAVYYNAISGPSESAGVSFRSQSPAPVISLSGTMLRAEPAGSSFKWYLNGNVLVGNTGNTLPSFGNGLYAASYLDSNGCYSALSAPFLLASNAGFLPGALKITPNPVPASFRILGLERSMPAAIYSTGGQCLLQFIAEPGSEIGMENLGPGIYEVRIGWQRCRLVKLP
ncbi:MAG: T9SS type A sorting domain-containing protein [Bacteroidota bacterium]